MELYLINDPRGKETRNGRMYHIEFRSFFWRKPGKCDYFLLFRILYIVSVIFDSKLYFF
jgi:hypothetical protein